MNLGDLLLRAFRTAIDLVVIASVVGVAFVAFKLPKVIKQIRPSVRDRLLTKFGKAMEFTAEQLTGGMIYSFSWGVSFKKQELIFGRPQNGISETLHRSDFPERFLGGIIVFPVDAKEVIFNRFHHNFPNAFIEIVFDVIDSIRPIAAKSQIKGINVSTPGLASAISFGLLLTRSWCDLRTKATFDEDCYCLDIAGLTFEVLCFLTAELIKVFDGKTALIHPAEGGVPWAIRLAEADHISKKKR
jgi:hypothetical protein